MVRVLESINDRKIVIACPSHDVRITSRVNCDAMAFVAAAGEFTPITAKIGGIDERLIPPH